MDLRIFHKWHLRSNAMATKQPKWDSSHKKMNEYKKSLQGRKQQASIKPQLAGDMIQGKMKRKKNQLNTACWNVSNHRQNEGRTDQPTDQLTEKQTNKTNKRANKEAQGWEKQVVWRPQTGSARGGFAFLMRPPITAWCDANAPAHVSPDAGDRGKWEAPFGTSSPAPAPSCAAAFNELGSREPDVAPSPPAHKMKTRRRKETPKPFSSATWSDSRGKEQKLAETRSNGYAADHL